MDRQGFVRKDFARAILWLGTGLSALAGPVPQVIPFSNNFDYAAGTPVQSLTNEGWDASSASIQVQTNIVCADTSAVVVPQATALTNWITGAMTKVWTDFHVMMESNNDTTAVAATSNAVINVFLDRQGYLEVFDRQSGWLALSNAVRGTPVTAFTNGQWGRLTLFQDYTTNQCAVFLDGILLKERLTFVSNRTACSRFRIEGGSTSSSYLDNFSMTESVPTGLADGAEIGTYGYLAFTLLVGTGLPYTTIQSALDAALDRYTINITNGTYAENVAINHNLAGITGGVFTINGTLAVAPGLAITSSVGFSSGHLTVSNQSVLSVAGSLHAGNVTTCTGAVVSISGGVTNVDMTLGTNSTTTIGQHLSGSNLTLQAGASLTVGGTLSLAGALAVAPSATLGASGPLAASSVAVNGQLSLGTGGGITASNLVLGSAASLYLTNANVSVSNLAIGAGCRLVVTNGTVVANGLTFSGTFVLDEYWGMPFACSTLPYEENFDIYQAGLSATSLGFKGWRASASGVAVEQGRYFSESNAVQIGYNRALSNCVNGAGVAQVWTDFRIIPTYDANDGTAAVNAAAAFMAVVTSNGYLSLFNRLQSAWETCTNDIWQNPVPRQTGQWSRVSVLCDYSTKECAVFLDGVLLRQRFPFINPSLASNSILTVMNDQTSATFLDNVYLGAAYPASLTNDINRNGMPDAQEILIYDDILRSGTIYRIR